MVEQDYIMRLIHEMVRALLKLLFNINTESVTEELLEDAALKDELVKLQELVDKGRINQAENELYDLMDRIDSEKLKMAMLFYSYVNEKDNDFLEKNDYSREEVEAGIKDVLKRSGMDGIAESIFLDE